MSTPSLWSRILVIGGSIAMLIGALDLMEGSLVILPDSGMVALGTFFGHRERRWIIYRVWVFILIAIGVGAMWGLTMAGGFGGKSGHSSWWGLLIIPYLLGWTMGIWGPGSPRWLLALGILVGAFYVALMPVILQRGSHFATGAIALGLLGVVTIIGCLARWKMCVAAKHSMIASQ